MSVENGNSRKLASASKLQLEGSQRVRVAADDSVKSSTCGMVWMTEDPVKGSIKSGEMDNSAKSSMWRNIEVRRWRRWR